jgi:hypothetical protein
MSGLRVGIIGCGSRAAWIAACLRAVDAEITFPRDRRPDATGARQRLHEADVPSDSACFVASTDELVERAVDLDGILIATRCNLHTPIAIQVAATGLPVFLEKPVSITDVQLRALHDAYVGRDASVVVSFPLSLTPLFQEVLRIVRSGRLGTINQVQASNYVSYGGVYFGQWYRDYEINGGLWLQKATHDFGLHQSHRPRRADRRRRHEHAQDLRRRPAADLECAACRLRRECPESPEAIALRDDDGGMGRGDHTPALLRIDPPPRRRFRADHLRRTARTRRTARISSHAAPPPPRRARDRLPRHAVVRTGAPARSKSSSITARRWKSTRWRLSAATTEATTRWRAISST